MVYAVLQRNSANAVVRSLSSCKLNGDSVFNYDLVIYDTYDYLDKVIGLSLKDVFVAAFKLYYDKTKDERALLLSKYIEFGTKDSIEIWLLRYGFSFEDIEWLKPCVKSINEEGIVFKDNINEVIQDIEKYHTLERFM